MALIFSSLTGETFTKLNRLHFLVSKAALVVVCLWLLPNSSQCQDAEKIFQHGNYLQSEGRFQEALIYVDSSLNIDSTAYQRYHFRADIKAKLGMFESAIDDVTKCIQRCKCPTRKFHVSSYYLRRAELQSLNGFDSAAFSDLSKSISFNPNNWRSYYFRSGLLIKSGNLSDALADLDKSIKVDDNQAETFIARAELRIEMGNLKGACSDLSQVVAWGIDRYQPWIDENCK